jgi:hypothetical protein
MFKVDTQEFFAPITSKEFIPSLIVSLARNSDLVS